MWAAATGKAPASQKPKIFGGSLVLDDYRPLTVIDLATGEVTVQLEGVYAQVGATNYGDVQAVATEDGTTLVNRRTGTFNMLGNDDYVLGPTNNGISLGRLAGRFWGGRLLRWELDLHPPLRAHQHRLAGGLVNGRGRRPGSGRRAPLTPFARSGSST